MHKFGHIAARSIVYRSLVITMTTRTKTIQDVWCVTVDTSWFPRFPTLRKAIEFIDSLKNNKSVLSSPAVAPSLKPYQFTVENAEVYSNVKLVVMDEGQATEFCEKDTWQVWDTEHKTDHVTLRKLKYCPVRNMYIHDGRKFKKFPWGTLVVTARN